ncbi:organic solute transporter Ostalpha-domain-containing protein [Phycomyces nitens]|nr:organic solute transporter Ostalpha-domain-containing protein [Phycomyces nitens]
MYKAQTPDQSVPSAEPWHHNIKGSGYSDGGSGSTFHPVAIHIAIICTIISTCISFTAVWSHWKNYRQPSLQRQVIRILLMVPIYGISTCISLVSLNTAFYVDTFRDIYEAFVLYAFFNLLLSKLGGERALFAKLHSRPPSKNVFPGSLWSREIFVGDPYTFLFVKRSILQFVYIKPILAILTMILKATGKFNEGEISWSSSYFYITFIYNISVCQSLWSLLVFFYATKEDLAGFRPLSKFLCIKSIIFFSFWQSVVITFLVYIGAIKDSGPGHISVAIQDILICIEMVPAAIGHFYSFTYKEYLDPNVHTARMPLFVAIKDSIGIKDVLMDSRDTFYGDRFSYRAFEPAVGLPPSGPTRDSRLMAGLRYSVSSAQKYWVKPVQPSMYIDTPRRGVNDEHMLEDEENEETLIFEDPSTSEDIEELYSQSRSFPFGDTNYPVIDFCIPLAQQERRGFGYGSIRATPGKVQRTGSNNETNRNESHGILPREGCIDVVVKGEDEYVSQETLDPGSNYLHSPTVEHTFVLASESDQVEVTTEPDSLSSLPPSEASKD